MKILLALLLISSLIFPQVDLIENNGNYKIQNEWKKYFDNSNVDGTFVLYNLEKDSLLVYNLDRAQKEYLPASTFKILNSLISLETGAIENENTIIKWDGVKRFLDLWNQDQTMRSAIKYSCVWFYQELARRIGFKKMQFYVDSSNYGNKKLGNKIDTFWLEGDLRISAIEQIEFLKKFILKDLPFDKQNLETVKNIMLVDSTENYSIYAKTGWATRIGNQIGWYVGFVETDTQTWIFALNIDLIKQEDAGKRIIITKEILTKEGIIP